jgi:hypothetical protein
MPPQPPSTSATTPSHPDRSTSTARPTRPAPGSTLRAAARPVKLTVCGLVTRAHMPPTRRPPDLKATASPRSSRLTRQCGLPWGSSFSPGRGRLPRPAAGSRRGPR